MYHILYLIRTVSVSGTDSPWATLGLEGEEATTRNLSGVRMTREPET